MKSFSQMLPKFAKPLAKRRGFAEGEILLHWPRIVPGLGKVTRPLKFYNGVLTLAVASSSVAQQVSFEKDGILSAVNMFMGHAAVKDIRTKIQPIPEVGQRQRKEIEVDEVALAAAKKRVAGVTDAGLRDSLARFLTLFEKEGSKR